MITKRIDWNEEARIAALRTDEQLHGALLDIRATLPNMDAMDRELGTDNGGFYRDQASVIHAEQKKRRNSPKVAK